MDVYAAMVAPNARPSVIGLAAGAMFATVLALAGSVTLAMLVPARRATSVDPALVLRQE